MTGRTGFVLSGFGSHAAVQVGMLRALVAAGKTPDMVVGVSAGAGNAAWLAARPDVAGVDALHRVWLEVARHDVPPLAPRAALRALLESLPFRPVNGVLRAVGIRNHILPLDPWSLLVAATGRGTYLASNRNPGRFLRQSLPIERLEEARIPLRVLATYRDSGDPVSLAAGDAVPALQASAAVPGVYPSVRIAGRELVDGWVARHTGIDEAVKLGAEEVYLLASGYTCNARSRLPRVTEELLYNLNVTLEQRVLAELAQERPGVRVHVVPPLCPLPVLPFDFSQSGTVIDRATEATRLWLKTGRPVPGLSRPLGTHGHDGPKTGWSSPTA